MISHYKKLGIPTSNKRFVFSDGLDDDKYIAIEKTFRLSAQCVGGIGTFLTNDVGVPALNMVIKMTSADFGKGAVDVVKLSDNIGKHTGSVDAIRQVKAELGIQ
jgi:nicotinate phosphoribosyltransferase